MAALAPDLERTHPVRRPDQEVVGGRAGAGGRHGEACRAEESGAGAPRAAAGAGGWGAARAAEQEGGAARAAEQEGKVRE